MPPIVTSRWRRAYRRFISAAILSSREDSAYGPYSRRAACHLHAIRAAIAAAAFCAFDAHKRGMMMPLPEPATDTSLYRARREH